MIHTHSQCLYFQLGQLAAIFDLPMSRIRYNGGVVGGGFGGKNHIHADHFAGLAAIKFGRPVKYRMTPPRGPALLDQARRLYPRVQDGRQEGRHAHRQPYQDMARRRCLRWVFALWRGKGWHVRQWSVPYPEHAHGWPVRSHQQGWVQLHARLYDHEWPVPHGNADDQDGREPWAWIQWELRFINAWRDGDIGISRYVVRGAGALEAMKAAAEWPRSTCQSNSWP